MIVACVSPGPTLTRETCDALAGRVQVLAISNAIKWCPWAQWHYACEAKWWRHFHHLPCAGQRWTAERAAADQYGLHHAPLLPVSHPGAFSGLCTTPYTLARGHHGGYQALNLALHVGATEIWLVGYDMREVNGRAHFFGEYTQPELAVSNRNYAKWAAVYDSINPDTYGVSIINMTPGSAIRRFPFGSLDNALRKLPQAA